MPNPGVAGVAVLSLNAVLTVCLYVMDDLSALLEIAVTSNQPNVKKSDVKILDALTHAILARAHAVMRWRRLKFDLLRGTVVMSEVTTTVTLAGETHDRH